MVVILQLSLHWWPPILLLRIDIMPVRAKKLNDSVASLLQETIKHDVSDPLVDTWVPSILWYEACLKSPLMSSYQGIFMEEGKLKFKHASLMSTPTMHPIYLDNVDCFDRAVNKTARKENVPVCHKEARFHTRAPLCKCSMDKKVDEARCQKNWDQYESLCYSSVLLLVER